MATRSQLLMACDALLQPQRFKDYGPNGLQVEGRDDIRLWSRASPPAWRSLKPPSRPKRMPCWFTMACSGAARMDASPAG